VTLFTHDSDLGPRPASVLVSILLHGLTIAILLFALAYKPPITKVITEHYSVREVDLNMQDEMARAVQNQMPRPKPNPGNPSQSAPAPIPKVEAPKGPQTLVQADLPKPITLPEPIPLPQVVIWSPSKTVVQKIVPPLPEKPTAANVKPSVQRPNEEMNLASVNISSSFTPSAKSIIPPSSTSPVAIPIPQQVQLPPISAAQSSAQPTPAAIVSLSDLRMKNGSANLPPVNEAVASNSQIQLTPNQMHDFSPVAVSIPSANPSQGSGQGPNGKAANNGSGGGQGSSGQNGNAGSGASAQTSNPGLNPYAEPTSTQITLPKQGRFGAVIVGNSLSDQYPEVTSVWSGRMAYTVYLHVGLAHSWIMQYALPRSADAASAGTVVSLDAPWPYSIVRPNLAPGSVDADAIMVHGFINQSGHFETLSLIVPPVFPQAQFILAALSKWQFRPASQGGQSTKVEVLIIIPESYN
jgi:hypothetical protein